jgi:hypothetical protein
MAIIGCRGFTAGKPFRGVTQVEGSRSEIGMRQRDPSETDQEERSSSERKAIFENIFTFL